MIEITAIFNQEPFSAINLINEFKKIPLLKLYYEKKVRHYTLEEHTLLVMSEYEKYFSKHLLTQDKKKNVFRLLLALHDVGKPIAQHKGGKNQQYFYTEKILNKLKDLLPISSEAFELIKNVVTFDPIGLFIQNKLSLPNAVSQIKNAAIKSNCDSKDFFVILSIYYQVDTASYTKDAGGKYFLEHLFTYQNNRKVFDKKGQLLKFSPQIEQKNLSLKQFFK